MCNFYFFPILLSWENIMGGNTIVIVIWLAHTPITNCQISKNVKFVIKFSIYLDFFLFYSTVKSVVTVWICERECKKEEREAKFSFELLIISSQTDPIITGPRFLLLLLLYFIVVWAWACSTLVRMGSRVRHRIPCRAVLDSDAAPFQLHRCFRG